MKTRETGTQMGKGFSGLQRDVIDVSLCTRCGGCASVCPVNVISMTQNGPELVGECIDCGRCLKVCPGPGTDMAGFERKLFGSKGRRTFLSFNGRQRAREHLIASDRAVFRKGYFGGKVSAVLIGALERGDIDCALLTDWSDGPGLSIGKGKLARTREEVLSLAGSKYVFSNVLTLLSGVRDDPTVKSAAVVCLPCQVQALRKMEEDPALKGFVSKVKYIISLNCGAPMVDEEEWGMIVEDMTGTKASSIKEFRAYKTSSKRIMFEVRTDKGWNRKELPIYHYFRRITRAEKWPRCLMCDDYSGELSDITFGAPIVRTKKGKELLERAKAEGRFWRPSFKRRTFQDLMDTYWALKKKRTARVNIKKRMRKGLKVPLKNDS